MSKAPIPAPPEVEEAIRAELLAVDNIPLYKELADRTESAMTRLTKADKAQISRQGVDEGLKDHPFDMEAVIRFQTSNIHHSACINTKVASSVGVGHLGSENGDGKVDRVLNPLCDETWQEVIEDVAEDYWQVGTGYIEVVRGVDGFGRITGIHHVPSKYVYVCVDNEYNRHYKILGGEGGSDDIVLAHFGDKKGFMERLTGSDRKPEEVSEIIPFRNPTSLSRWYGFPDWISAVPSIELVQMMLQQQFDFFLNRGVPEFMLFILGQKLPEDDWKTVLNAIRANIGQGNSHKSLALNLQNPEIKVQLEKLAMESKSEEGFAKSKESLAMDIVSAHRVPPLLAGIQIPGKLGATNELPNALMAFQILVIGPAQRQFQQQLGASLGREPNLGLTVKDFGFRKITDEINLQNMDTISRMREPAAEGRDPGEGLKD